MDFLPIFINIRNRKCLVIGGGKVAAGKIALLSRAGARITVIAPKLDTELQGLLRQGIIVHRAEIFTPAHLEDATLVFAATNDRLVNQQISKAAEKLRIPINVVDNPDLCSFIMPSIIDRSPILVAVSSSGKSPVLARLLRARLETMIPEAYGRLATYAANFREQVKQHFSHPDKRRMFWENELQGPFSEMVFAGKYQAAKDHLEHSLHSESDEAPHG